MKRKWIRRLLNYWVIKIKLGGNMETSVKLQEPFSYSMWPIVVVGALVILYGIYLFVTVIMRKKETKPSEQVVVKKVATIDVNKIKMKYLTQLELIRQELCKEKITTRDAYQKMSRCIRGFVYEVTGIQVQNYTLEDIKKLNMPGLEALIAEYYAPEFALRSISDSSASLEKTKRAIELWN